MTDAEIIAAQMRLTGVERDQLVNTFFYDHMIVTDNETTHGVYVQINLDSYVTAIDSDAFIPDLGNWIKVDEGRGELYKYARVNYCPKGLQTDGGRNYKLVDGVVVYAPQVEQPEDHNEMASQEEFFVASRNYQTGELISIQGRMFETTAVIPDGCKIVPGSNCNEITMEQYINRKIEEATKT